MCVIAYKPNNIAFPSDTILKNCYENNPDGAGFMYAYKGEVHIQKGYETWEAFKNALDKARKLTGDKVPYVMHFRIATQGYEKTMTHPFPLSSKMSNLKKLKYDCNIGVAHNGILDLTSDGSKDYSDTMKFITDYLCLIIRSYTWYNDDRTTTLIERLIEGSRLAILDKKGHCQLMGNGWVEDNNVYYSNDSYKREPYKWSAPMWWDSYDDDGYYLKKTTKGSTVKTTVHTSGTSNKKQKKVYTSAGYYEKYYNYKTGEYEFPKFGCPELLDNDSSYCYACSKCGNCAYMGTAVADM